MKERVKNYMTGHHMTEYGDTVCVGLSGGADSVCLLILLEEMSKELGIKVTAFHVNHCLRGRDSDDDQAFARELCMKMQIPLKEFRYDIAGMADKLKKGLEETGRLMRRKAAAEAAAYFGAGKIALAHHANDNAETVLFNLARGSSAGGMKGILPVNGNLIRPLLCVERYEIEDELKARKTGWREDVTNQSTDYSRNMLRNVIIPDLAEHINKGAVRHINEAAEDMAEAAELIEEEALDRLEQYSVRIDGRILLKNGIMSRHRIVNGRIALLALERLTGSAVDLGRIHAREIEKLFEKQTGRRIELPYRTLAERTYEGVLLGKNEETDKEKDQLIMDEIPLPVNGTAVFHGFTIRTILMKESELPEKIPEKQYTKWLDYDKITKHGFLRTRRSGDYMVINSEGGRKKLKDYLINEKIPKDRRDSLICLACGREIMWVIGYRISENAKVTRETKTVIEIKLTGNGINER